MVKDTAFHHSTVNLFKREIVHMFNKTEKKGHSAGIALCPL